MSADKSEQPFDEYAPQDQYDALTPEQWRPAITDAVRTLRKRSHRVNGQLVEINGDLSTLREAVDGQKAQTAEMISELKKLHDDNVKANVKLGFIAWSIPVAIAVAGVLAKYIHTV